MLLEISDYVEDNRKTEAEARKLAREWVKKHQSPVYIDKTKALFMGAFLCPLNQGYESPCRQFCGGNNATTELLAMCQTLGH